MKTLLVSVLLLFFATTVFGQKIYSKAYGNKNNPAILFLHGGPGYNSVDFQVSTAQKLANEGFYVIVYDRRGEGRSKDVKANYTYKQSFEDIDSLLKKYDVQKVNLIGHSFGGLLATFYAEKEPKNVSSVTLVSTPISFQKSLKLILNTVKKIYQKKKDSVNLRYVQMLENMDTASLQYASYLFMHALANASHFYVPSQPSANAQKLYSELRKDSLMKEYASQAGRLAPRGFWKNEHYTTANLTKGIQALVKDKIPVFGLYGQGDGFISTDQIAHLKKLIGKNHVKYWMHCAHNVFIDRQNKFLEQVKEWLR